MILVGLTGGIGSGKSTVSSLLEDKGAVIIDADAIVREVQLPGSPVLAKLAEKFGAEVLASDGSLDRQAVANIVFTDPDALKALNAIVHPAVGLEMNRRMIEQRTTDNIVILDIPLLTENPREGLQGKIVVDVPVEVQVERLTKFRGFDETDARARIGRQATREQRLETADFVVDNAGDLAALESVLANIEIDRRQVDDAEVHEDDESPIEIIGLDGASNGEVDLCKTMQHPAFKPRHFLARHSFIRREPVQRAEQITKSISQLAIGLDIRSDDIRTEGRIVGEVAGGDPETQNVGSILVTHFLWRDHIAKGFGHLAPVLGQNKSVGEDGVIRGPAARRAAFQKRGLEPAPVLVGALKIEIGRPLLAPIFQSEGMGRAAVEPDVKNIANLVISIRIAIRTEERRRGSGKPRIRSARSDSGDNAGVHLVILEDLACLPVDKKRQRHAPGALP